MSEYMIKPLDASTWDAFARLVEKHNGMGFVVVVGARGFTRERVGPRARWA